MGQKNKKENNLKSYFKFYNQYLKKRHLILNIILMIIFLIVISYKISTMDTSINMQYIGSQGNTISNTNILLNIAFNIMINFVTLILGMVPFANLSLIGFMYPYLVLSNSSIYHEFNMLHFSIGYFFLMLSLSLSIATGLYYCNILTKKRKGKQKERLIIPIDKIVITFCISTVITIVGTIITRI